MYTVSKGPSKIVAKTRRAGINQNLERLENREHSKRPLEYENNDRSSVPPRPVFHNNSKRTIHCNRQPEALSPQHEEIIRYIHDSWSTVYQQITPPASPVATAANNNCCSTVYYNDGEPNAILQDFKPFDLESWWGKRLFNNITKSL